MLLSSSDDHDRNDEIQQIIARAESNARHYISNFHVTTATLPTLELVRPVAVSSPTEYT
jgi:hypothetical protein